MDDGPYPPLYPIRGVKTSDGWELGALTFDEIEEIKTDFFVLGKFKKKILQDFFNIFLPV